MKPFALPNLPTDNLYKFYAISGIVLILFTLTFESIVLLKIEAKSYRLKEQIELNELQASHLYKDILSLEKETELLKNEVDEYSNEKKTNFVKSKTLDDKLEKLESNSDYRDYLEFYYSHKEDLIPEYGKLNEIIELKDKYVLKLREYDIKSALIEIKKDELSNNIKDFDIFFYFGIILIVQGYFLSFYGFKKWKLKVQNNLDKKLELELKLAENQLDKSNSIE